jgi:cytochrome c oxidase subunit 3
MAFLVRLLATSGVAGVFYVVTGVHGGHVFVGLLLIVLYTVQLHTWHVWSAYSMDAIHGVVGVILYWHFVDMV